MTSRELINNRWIDGFRKIITGLRIVVIRIVLHLFWDSLYVQEESIQARKSYKFQYKKTHKIDKFVEPELTQLSQCCTKTSSSSTFESYLITKVPMYDKLWDHYGDKKFARLSFEVIV